MKTYYEELGVCQSASIEEIKKAYLELIKKYHPDVYEGEKQFAIEQTQKLNIIFNTLKDEQQRKIDGGIFSGLKKRVLSAFEDDGGVPCEQNAQLSSKQRLSYIIGAVVAAMFVLLLILLLI